MNPVSPVNLVIPVIPVMHRRPGVRTVSGERPEALEISIEIYCVLSVGQASKSTVAPGERWTWAK